MRLPVHSHRLYTDAIDDRARFPKHRYRLVRERLESEPDTFDVRASPLANFADLVPAHARSFVRAFLQGELTEVEQRRVGMTPWTEHIRERTLRIMGGSLAALDAAMTETGVAGNLAGGTHHAHRDFGSGFCVFNDIALIVQRARRMYGLKRILVVDLDVHQGDGTASMFVHDPQVYTFSTHCRANFPFRKCRSSRDLAFPPGTLDGPYLSSLEHHLDASLSASHPELVVFQAGVDGLGSDKLGRLKLTREGLFRRNRMVLERTAGRGLVTVVVMGGGYADPLDHSIDAHADVYQEAARHVFTPSPSPARSGPVPKPRSGRPDRPGGPRHPVESP